LESEAVGHQRQARAELEAIRSLQALQLDTSQRAVDIADMLDAGEARRINMTAHVWERKRSKRVVAELEIRFAWCRCVGTSGREAGGTWKEQHWALTELYSTLGQEGRDPTAVMAEAGGVPDKKAISVEMWRFICAGLSLKYDLPTPEAVEAQHALLCGGASTSADEWDRVRRELEASAAGEEGAVRARHPQISLIGARPPSPSDPSTASAAGGEARPGGSPAAGSGPHRIPVEQSAEYTSVNLGWSGAWAVRLEEQPEPEPEPEPKLTPRRAGDRRYLDDPADVGERLFEAAAAGSSQQARAPAKAVAMPMRASAIEAGEVRRACVGAVGLGISSAKILNDQARLMVKRKEIQEHYPRLLAAQEATRTAQRRKAQAARRLEASRRQRAAAAARNQF
jgi:hypothetical protein